MALIRAAILALVVTALVGCGKEPTSANTKVPDPYAGLSGEAKVDAIRKDPNLLGGERASRISEAQKAAGLPVTGQ